MFIYKALSAIAAAAFGAAVVLALPGFSPEVEARTPAPGGQERPSRHPAAHRPGLHRSRPGPTTTPAACASTRANGQPRTVRVVTTDRIAR